MSWLFSWVCESVRLCVWACVYVCANVLHNKSECTKRLFRKNLQNENEFKHKPKGKNVNKQFYKLIVNLFYSKNEHSAIWMLQKQSFLIVKCWFILSPVHIVNLFAFINWTTLRMAARRETGDGGCRQQSHCVNFGRSLLNVIFSPKPTRFVKFLFGCGTFQTAGQWHCFGSHIEGISHEYSHSRPAHLTAN